MTQRSSLFYVFGVRVVALLGTGCWSSTASAAPPIGADVADRQVLTRGPIHEAFAEPVVFNPKGGRHRGQGADPAESRKFRRISDRKGPMSPGSWLLELGRRASDFLWVSGISRALPPGRQSVARILGRIRPGFAMDVRILGRCHGQRGRISTGAASDGRSGAQCCRAFAK